MYAILELMADAEILHRLQFLFITQHADLHPVNRPARQLMPPPGRKRAPHSRLQSSHSHLSSTIAVVMQHTKIFREKLLFQHYTRKILSCFYKYRHKRSFFPRIKVKEKSRPDRFGTAVDSRRLQQVTDGPLFQKRSHHIGAKRRQPLPHPRMNGSVHHMKGIVAENIQQHEAFEQLHRIAAD